MRAAGRNGTPQPARKPRETPRRLRAMRPGARAKQNQRPRALIQQMPCQTGRIAAVAAAPHEEQHARAAQRHPARRSHGPQGGQGLPRRVFHQHVPGRPRSRARASQRAISAGAGTGTNIFRSPSEKNAAARRALPFQHHHRARDIPLMGQGNVHGLHAKLLGPARGRPRKAEFGASEGRRSTSTSRMETPSAKPVPSALTAASLAAKRPATKAARAPGDSGRSSRSAPVSTRRQK